MNRRHPFAQAMAEAERRLKDLGDRTTGRAFNDEEAQEEDDLCRIMEALRNVPAEALRDRIARRKAESA